jgi:RNA recognition motif-containing protein
LILSREAKDSFFSHEAKLSFFFVTFFCSTELNVRLDRGVSKPEAGAREDRPPRKERKSRNAKPEGQVARVTAEKSSTGNPPAPSKSLFVHNLSWGITDDALFEYFSAEGNPISAEVKRSGKDGRSRGWAVVTYGSVDEASMAMLKLHESELDGRQISIRYDAKAAN